MLIKNKVSGKNKALISILFFLFSSYLNGQAQGDTLISKVTLSDCRTYALKNQPLVKQSILDQDITRRDIRVAMSGWYPQLEFDASMQHYFQIPENQSSANISSGIFSANQSLYNNRLFFNARTAGELRNKASENTLSSKINTYVDVTRAFFDVLLTKEQINVLEEAILRLERNYKDAYSLYQNGLTDKIDYQRTEISLSNTRSQKKFAQESLKAKYSVLKQIMGVVPENQIVVSYDTSAFETEILADTAKNLDYGRRIEYQQLQTAMKLQNYDIGYYKWSFLPTVSAFYNYNSQYHNDLFADLYLKAYPSSLVGLRLSIPLFQGMSRVENLKIARLQYQRLQFEMDFLKSGISSEYTLALARYTSNLQELKISKSNIVLARDIFNTVRLQYEKGIKAYLEVIVSETDLRTAELNYLNTLFQVLSSKLDLEKATGDININ